jgi:hypothetical protein
MKVNIVSGPFVSTKMLVELISHDPSKDPVFVTINTVDELSKKVKEIGATTVTTLGQTFVFKEAY